MKGLTRIRILLFTLYILITALSSGTGCFASDPVSNDTIDIQTLYNGRAWRNLFYKVRGDQFLFSPEFLPGSVTIHGKLFKNIPLKYDIYNDELLIITDQGIIIQLNKEMIEKFTLNYENQILSFRNFDADSINSLTGYVNVVYEGGISLYIKYRKEILSLAVENKYDLFNQVNKVFVKHKGEIIRVDSKTALLKLFKDQKHQVRSFIRSSKLRVSRKYPDNFKPVIEYYDKLHK